VLTPCEAARLLRCGRRQVYESIHRREIPSFRIGRSLRIPKAALMRLLGVDTFDATGAVSRTSDTTQGARDVDAPTSQ
jgi:excisionase family DNA binding protein